MKIMEHLKKVFSLDYRSLALMRIGAGIIIILDLAERVRSLTAHYTDAGVLPRANFLELYNNPWLISVHNMSGTAVFELVLFIIAFLFAVSMLIGYRTTLATAISWFLLVSLQNRNPLVLQGGDGIFRCIMFFAMFLPWGKRWSFDNFLNRQKPAEEKTVFSAGTIAYITQIFLFYFFAGVLKTGAQWHDGTALYYTLNIDQFATRLGHWLLNFPALLKFLTKSTLVLETYGAIAMVFPLFNQYTRLVAVILFAIFQIGINTSMSIGLFGTISVVITFGLLPSIFWDKVLPWFALSRRKGLTMYYDRDCGFCTRAIWYVKRLLFLSEYTKVIPAQEAPEIEEVMRRENSWVIVDEMGRKFYGFDGLIAAMRFSPLWWPLIFILKLPGIHNLGEWSYKKVAESRLTICLPPKKERFSQSKEKRRKFLRSAGEIIICTFTIFIICWNIDTIPSREKKIVPNFLKPVAWVTRMDQKFDMFAPYPMTDDGWYVIPGKLRNGSEVDVYKDGAPVSYGKPPLVSKTYMDQRWQKYIMNLWRSDFSKYRLYYGKYLCRTWNNEHTEDGEKLEEFKIIYMREDTLPNYQTPTIKPTTTWEHYCFK